jgi:hypothetical protein
VAYDTMEWERKEGFAIDGDAFAQIMANLISNAWSHARVVNRHCFEDRSPSCKATITFFRVLLLQRLQLRCHVLHLVPDINVT